MASAQTFVCVSLGAQTLLTLALVPVSLDRICGCCNPSVFPTLAQSQLSSQEYNHRTGQAICFSYLVYIPFAHFLPPSLSFPAFSVFSYLLPSFTSNSITSYLLSSNKNSSTHPILSILLYHKAASEEI